MDKDKTSLVLTLLISFLMLGGNTRKTHNIRTTDNSTPRSPRPERNTRQKPRTKGYNSRYRH